MREQRHALLHASARRVIPVILLVALYFLLRAESGGALQGGALAALALVLHAVLYGAATTLLAVPPLTMRVAVVTGVVVLLVGATMQSLQPGFWVLAIDFGLFLSVAAGFALAFAAIAGRAHELRDGDW